MDVGRRLKLGLLALVAMIGVSVVITTAAQARTVPDPMLSNVPYLAWRGEEVRVVKCVPPENIGGLTADEVNADFALVDWSGDPHLASPVLEPSTTMFGTRSFDGAACFGATFVSQKAGLADIKLTLSNAATGQKMDTHDFLVGWMNLNSLVLCNNPAAGPCIQPLSTSAVDVAGQSTPNVLEANVTGNIPLLQDYNELGIGHAITLPDKTTANGLVMPDDWATLANALATVRGAQGDPVSFWDIHDDTTPYEGHAQEAPAICQPRVTTGIDAVDQCTDTGSLALADEAGPFSSIYLFPTADGLSQMPTYGPFDPARPGETLLADGKVDAGDAPMPAARIDFTIAPNTGAATDISGVGTFTKVDKGLCEGTDLDNTFGCFGGIYVRLGGGTPHHLYAPFYRSFIPATAADFSPTAGANPFSSGIDAGLSNNFNGFLNITGNAEDATNSIEPGLYDFWDIAEVLRDITAAPTTCLNRNINGTPVFQTTPGTGPQSVVTYTDEHGEARTGFMPGTGFFFDNFGIQNSNLGCDLAGIATLGTATITATARYPFEPVTAQPLVSNTVAKTVASLFVKLIQCFPKGPSAFDQQTAVCVAHAQDITGTAITGERVCFFSNGEGQFLPQISPITIVGQTTWPAISIIPAGTLGNTANNCALTDVNGNTAIEVVESDAETINVSAFFVDEGLFRSVHVTFPLTAATAAVTGPVAASHLNPQTTQGSGTVPVHTGSGTTQVPTSHVDTSVKVRYRVTYARLRGKLLTVRLSGPKGRAQLAISYVAKNTKTLGTLVKSVPANKKVKLRLNIPKRVSKLRLSVMPG